MSSSTYDTILPLAVLREHVEVVRSHVLRLEVPVSLEDRIAAIEPDTPGNLRDFIHYAAIWGVCDDGYRMDLIQAAPEWAKQNLKWVVVGLEDRLDDWLAGSAANANPITEAYVAFTCLRMAADEAVAFSLDDVCRVRH